MNWNAWLLLNRIGVTMRQGRVRCRPLTSSAFPQMSSRRIDATSIWAERIIDVSIAATESVLVSTSMSTSFLKIKDLIRRSPWSSAGESDTTDVIDIALSHRTTPIISNLFNRWNDDKAYKTHTLNWCPSLPLVRHYYSLWCPARRPVVFRRGKDYWDMRKQYCSDYDWWRIVEGMMRRREEVLLEKVLCVPASLLALPRFVWHDSWHWSLLHDRSHADQASGHRAKPKVPTVSERTASSTLRTSFARLWKTANTRIR